MQNREVVLSSKVEIKAELHEKEAIIIGQIVNLTLTNISHWHRREKVLNWSALRTVVAWVEEKYLWDAKDREPEKQHHEKFKLFEIGINSYPKILQIRLSPAVSTAMPTSLRATPRQRNLFTIYQTSRMLHVHSVLHLRIWQTILGILLPITRFSEPLIMILIFILFIQETFYFLKLLWILGFNFAQSL